MEPPSLKMAKPNRPRCPGQKSPNFPTRSHPPCSCCSFPVLTPGVVHHQTPKQGSCLHPTSSPDFSCLLQRVLRLPPGRARAARPGAAACPGGATAGAQGEADWGSPRAAPTGSTAGLCCCRTPSAPWRSSWGSRRQRAAHRLCQKWDTAESAVKASK